MVRKFGLVTLALTSLTGLANAADFAPPPPVEPEWVFTAAGYGWLSGIKGSVASFGAPESDIDLSISDVLKHFEGGLMGAGEARHGRFLLATDLMWAKLSADTDRPILGHVELTASTLAVTGLAGYSLVYEEGGNLDAIAGARLWSVKNELDFSGGAPVGEFEDSATWVDPVVGLKGRANISPNFYVTAWGLVGGFGVSSDLMWDVMGSVGYEFNDSFSMTAGYRVQSVDYHNNGFVYDVVQSGPMIGAVFKF
jgi:hypothetical protein